MRRTGKGDRPVLAAFAADIGTVSVNLIDSFVLKGLAMAEHTTPSSPPSASWRCDWLAALAVLVAAVPALGEQPLAVAQKQGAILVESGGRLVLEYQVVANPLKPYVKQLATPGGVNVLRDSPADHKHHHGLMFAVAADGVDFWSENAACGRQLGRPIGPVQASSRDGQSQVVFSQAVEWKDARSQETLIDEQRTVKVHQIAGVPATLVTWQCRLTVPPRKEFVTLTGSPYFGLGMRFLVSMDTGGQFQNADGQSGVKGTNAARSAWCAYTAVADGKPVTVAMFDDKSNPRHPATWFTMEKFAYMSATLNLNKQSLRIDAGKPLELRYGVALWDGKVEKNRIDEAYRRWLALAATGQARAR